MEVIHIDQYSFRNAQQWAVAQYNSCTHNISC